MSEKKVNEMIASPMVNLYEFYTITKFHTLVGIARGYIYFPVKEGENGGGMKII